MESAVKIKFPLIPEWSLKILMRRELSIAKIAKPFEGNYEAKLEIPGGGEGSNITTLGRGGDTFWNHPLRSQACLKRKFCDF